MACGVYPSGDASPEGYVEGNTPQPTNDAYGLPGERLDLIYLGNARRFLGRLLDGQKWTVLMQADAAAASGLLPGRPVGLSWQPRHAAAFSAHRS